MGFNPPLASSKGAPMLLGGFACGNYFSYSYGEVLPANAFRKIYVIVAWMNLMPRIGKYLERVTPFCGTWVGYGRRSTLPGQERSYQTLPDPVYYFSNIIHNICLF